MEQTASKRCAFLIRECSHLMRPICLGNNIRLCGQSELHFRIARDGYCLSQVVKEALINVRRFCGISACPATCGHAEENPKTRRDDAVAGFADDPGFSSKTCFFPGSQCIVGTIVSETRINPAKLSALFIKSHSEKSP